MNPIKIQDESGDKKYFTQLPNIILNHSTANDQALYMQMKRFAGEDGKCFATQETLCKKLGIGTKAYNKSLEYLLKRKWIKYEGMTQGKTRPIKTYSVVDIWKQNIMEYEKILVESTVSFDKEILVESKGDTCQKHSKILVESTVEEEPSIIRTNKNILATAVAEPINKFIEMFKEVNPSYGQLYKDKTQRACLDRLLKLMGGEKLENCIKTLAQTNQMEFAPVITTPYLLEKKLGNLIAFVKKQNINKNKTIII